MKNVMKIGFIFFTVMTVIGAIISRIAGGSLFILVILQLVDVTSSWSYFQIALVTFVVAFILSIVFSTIVAYIEHNKYN